MEVQCDTDQGITSSTQRKYIFTLAKHFSLHDTTHVYARFPLDTRRGSKDRALLADAAQCPRRHRDWLQSKLQKLATLSTTEPKYVAAP
ncbi:hypothetical protein SPRG_04391 [Saprolegnia parasitica CBS 223.65]|uniref:Uncharacterized protein n=1 Tax=Saprolegnia parasitica (strain CBS 223.65) TaxID=695850 RepID=A0A067CIX9_SAPPC|nr:hypothetical protein SPRG_04391 [Saprolegnia parasitica CBS 223.65]KDO30488.1 hypothetical protein SPRG_04391 [Saprolegnia parasitica CBS 223.65]|eukprot:XP_012198710.1 hypothetical protein SPRG_04391 [Saprolegnia parasitica CBS 223.65]